MTFKALMVVTFGGIAALLLFSGCGSHEIPEGTVVTVLYTGDVRGKIEGCGCKHSGGGITRRSAAIRAARDVDPSVVYCDPGNFLSGTPAVDSTQGEISIAAYNHMKATVANVSERELAFGMDAFKRVKKDADFAMISANLKHNGGAVADPYFIKRVKEARVAFLGLCGTKDVMRFDSLNLPAGVTIEDPIAAAGKYILTLKDKSDILVVLSTCGDAVDSALAKRYPDIDLIIGGRSYRYNAAEPWIIDKTRIVRAQRDGRSLGRLDFAFGPANTLKTYLPSLVSLETNSPADGEMLAVIREYVPSYVDNPTEGARILGTIDAAATAQ